MAKVIKGSAHYADDGTYIFTPYEQGKPENQVWIPLATEKYGKMECSKNKLRIILTIDRQDENVIFSLLTRSVGRILAKLLNARVQKLFRKAERMTACELRDDINEVKNADDGEG